MNEATKPESRRRLGDFEIVRQIGRGGMGIVYEARQVSLNRKVALKVLSGSLGLTSKAVVRFRREAEAAGKLHHTNIVPIYATGEADGTHFYAMELIEGPSLNVVIRELRHAGLPGETRRPEESEPEARARDTKGGMPGRQRGHEERPAAHARESTANDTTTLPSWLLETISAAPEGGMPKRQRGHEDATVGDSSSSLTTAGGYFDTIARMIAEVADALDYAHDQGVIHRDIKPSNLLLSPAGRLSINDFGLARMLEQPGMTTTGEFVGSPLYMSPEQITAGRAPLDHRTDIYSLGATLYELLTLQPPYPGERRDQVIAKIIHKEPRPLRRVNRKVPVDLETICLKALEKDPDRRYQTAGQMAEDLRRFVNRFAISAKRAGLVARTVKWVRRRPAVAALIVLLLIATGSAGFFARRARQQNLQRIAEQGQHALDQAVVKVLSGRYDEVEHWLERAEVWDIDPGRIRVLRGLAAVEQGRIKEALHELELAVQQLPDSMGAQALLVRAYMEDGQFSNALALFPKIQRLRPVTTEDRLYGAWAVGWWHPEQAIEWLEQLAAQRPSPAVNYMLGMFRHFELADSYNPHDIEKTLAECSAAKTQMPDNVRAICFHFLTHLVAADIYRLQGDATRLEIHLDQARKDAQDLLQHHAEVGDAHAMNRHLAEFEGRWQDALAHQRNAASRPGLWAFQQYPLPRLLYRLGRLDEALDVLDAMPEALKTPPLWVRARAFIIAELQWAQVKRTDEAAATYHYWLEQCRTLPAGRDLPHEVYQFLGRPQDALRSSQDRLREASPPLRQESYRIAADQYICGGLSAEVLLAAATKRAERMHAHYLVGLEHLSEGDRPGAVEHFAEVERVGHYTLSSQPWALLLLERLREDPTWPPWIPMKNIGVEDPVSSAPSRPEP